MSVTKNLYLDQGADFSTRLTVVDSAAAAPIDLTGYAVTAQMSKYFGSSTTYNLPILITDPLVGAIRFNIPSAVSELYPAGAHFYDVEITDPAGEKTRVFEGVIVIRPRIARSV